MWVHHASGPAMGRNDVSAQRRMVIMLEIGPIEYENQLFARTYHELRPCGCEFLDVDSVEERPFCSIIRN